MYILAASDTKRSQEHTAPDLQTGHWHFPRLKRGLETNTDASKKLYLCVSEVFRPPLNDFIVKKWKTKVFRYS